jgi:hypothetical protein
MPRKKRFDLSPVGGMLLRFGVPERLWELAPSAEVGASLSRRTAPIIDALKNLRRSSDFAWRTQRHGASAGQHRLDAWINSMA